MTEREREREGCCCFVLFSPLLVNAMVKKWPYTVHSKHIHREKKKGKRQSNEKEKHRKRVEWTEVQKVRTEVNWSSQKLDLWPNLILGSVAKSTREREREEQVTQKEPCALTSLEARLRWGGWGEGGDAIVSAMVSRGAVTSLVRATVWSERTWVTLLIGEARSSDLKNVCLAYLVCPVCSMCSVGLVRPSSNSTRVWTCTWIARQSRGPSRQLVDSQWKVQVNSCWPGIPRERERGTQTPETWKQIESRKLNVALF